MPLFDFHTYLGRLTACNRLARREGFRFATCSGLEELQGVLDAWRQASAFVVADDVATGETVRLGGGWFQRRTFTVFILMRHDWGDEPGRRRALDVCRELRRQLQSRFLRDEPELGGRLAYLHVEDMPSTELAQYAVSGCTGLYFMTSIDEPVDISYDDNDWDDDDNNDAGSAAG